MSANQLWGPEEDIPDLVSDDSEDEEALVARPPRPPRPDAEALLTLGVRHLPQAAMHGITAVNIILFYLLQHPLCKNRCSGEDQGLF